MAIVSGLDCGLKLDKAENIRKKLLGKRDTENFLEIKVAGNWTSFRLKQTA